jgi:ubiquinone/menaquinone biosynthesis C-methylase UbiE
LLYLEKWAASMTGYVSDLNHRVWSTRRIASSYAKRVPALFPAEDTIIKMLASELSQGRLLDIGIGAGRTTAHVKDRCGEYVGIDYSAEMIDRARTQFQNLDLRVIDARDLSAFGSQTFDIVMFSYNGLDYLAHDDRLKALKEINRVLRKDGAFIFSTHNRDSRINTPNALRNLNLTDNLANLPKNLARYALGIVNSARMKQFERHETEYALLNDEGERYRLMTYYISLDAQIAQLERIGFAKVRAFSLEGTEIVLHGSAPPVSGSDYMIHFVARKKMAVHSKSTAEKAAIG